jgi:c-di-GMP-binding flagellar brake protein YcgR
MSWDGTERRKRKRYGIRGSTVRYKISGLFSFLAPYSPKYLLLNFSDGGCHFITKSAVEAGAEIDLEIEAPKIRGSAQAHGRVVWSRKSEQLDAFRIGVEFRKLGSRSGAVLKKMLDVALLENVDITTKHYLKEIEKL